MKGNRSVLGRKDPAEYDSLDLVADLSMLSDRSRVLALSRCKDHLIEGGLSGYISVEVLERNKIELTDDDLLAVFPRSDICGLTKERVQEDSFEPFDIEDEESLEGLLEDLRFVRRTVLPRMVIDYLDHYRTDVQMYRKRQRGTPSVHYKLKDIHPLLHPNKIIAVFEADNERDFIKYNPVRKKRRS